MEFLSEKGQAVAQEVAARHGVSTDAVATLLRALAQGNGSQAQFNHPDLGGMGQWSLGGMVMVGDMFNNALKAQVDAICTELSGHMNAGGLFRPAPKTAAQSQSQSSGTPGVSLFVSGGMGGGQWWPEDLGTASSVGSQNNLRYAVFPATRRLAIDIAGHVSIYDTGDHAISGVSQQQSGDQSLSFTSQNGLVHVSQLRKLADPSPPAPETTETPEPESADVETAPSAPAPISPAPKSEEAPPPPPSPAQSAPAAPSQPEDDVFAKLERLAGLYAKGVITETEFEAKKSELLSRI
ncbi:MAG: SHOCT domain-containing protein [Pseudomonadota bacterium]